MGKITKYDKSIIPAADVKDIAAFRELVGQTHDVQGIGGYKVGAILTIRYGLPKLVEVVREFTDLPIIYDHQKGMTDIPDTARDFLESIKNSGTNAFIGFPQSGPATEEAWIKTANEIGLELLIGGEMTHPKYKKSEGGYIADESLDEIYLLAARLGVNNFIVPGNKMDRVAHYLEMLKPVVKTQISFWAPGFVAQGGTISDAAKAAGESFHAIVGRGIYAAKDMRSAAEEMTRQLLNK